MNLEEVRFPSGKYDGKLISECDDLSYLCMAMQHGWRKFNTLEIRRAINKVIMEKTRLELANTDKP